MKVAAIVGVVLLVVAGVALWLFRSPSTDDFEGFREYKLTPLAKYEFSDGVWEFRAFSEDSGLPSIAYSVPGQGGASAFRAVDRGGWAVEYEVIEASDREVIYGASILDAAEVRYPLKGGGFGKLLPVRVPGIDVAFFVGIVKAGTIAGGPNDVTAFDAAGNLLGRTHTNDGKGGFGACDGSFDRAHAACK